MVNTDEARIKKKEKIVGQSKKTGTFLESKGILALSFFRKEVKIHGFFFYAV